MVEIGSKIRKIRQQGGMSGAQLARLTGFSASYISQIERGKVSPSLRSLFKLSAVLGVPVAGLFEQPDIAKNRVALVRSRERRRLRYSGSGASYELLLPSVGGQVGVSLVTIPPGSRSGDEPFVHAGEEWGIMLEGVLEYQIGDEEYLLQVGDAIHFKSSVPHRWRNPGPAAVRVVFVDLAHDEMVVDGAVS